MGMGNCRTLCVRQDASEDSWFMKIPFAPFTKRHFYSIITSCQPMVYGVTKHRGMEQLVARRAHNPKVRG
ncbi:hypothetical protein, partial [uncultured Selenomonas sp.]|uniref:hypothetical protein n=1 Tax=uncultured Selenomonas sp. TaxID=159275 RepID=UPI00260869EB